MHIDGRRPLVSHSEQQGDNNDDDDDRVATGHRCHLHPLEHNPPPLLEHNQSLISVIWLEFCGGLAGRRYD